MSDPERYVRRRAARTLDFAEGLEDGFANLRIGVLLRQAAGLTQAQVAHELRTKKSAISRIEDHAGDIRLSTRERYARALGRRLSVELPPHCNAR